MLVNRLKAFVMNRRVTVCHICGLEIKRFSDHIAAAHNRLNYRKEKVSVISHAFIQYTELLM